MFEFIFEMPIATIVILAVASVLGLFSAKMHGKFVDIEKSKKIRDEMGTLRKQMFEARRKGDKKTYARLQREQSQVWGQYSGVMKGQMRVMMYTMVPFFIIYIILSQIFGTTPVAIAPFPLPELPFYPPFVGESHMLMPFWAWYVLAAFAINMPLNRLYRMFG
ncbi:MAG: EMC3/TMCO1 family protein [Candidatus Bathyarchaeota archaeon]